MILKRSFQHISLPPALTFFAELELISSRPLFPRASLKCGIVLRPVFHCHLLSFRWCGTFYDCGPMLALCTSKQSWIIISHHLLWVAKCSVSTQATGEVLRSDLLHLPWSLCIFTHTSKWFNPYYQAVQACVGWKHNQLWGLLGFMSG